MIREMSFNFPGDVLLAGPDHGLQFMVGDKIVVAAGVLLGSETSVYLPTSQNETWYRRNQNSYQRVVPQKGNRLLSFILNFYFLKVRQPLISDAMNG